MPLTDPNLWNLIRTWHLPYRDEMDFGVEPDRRCRCFADNLRKAGDWTDSAARDITDAYRRFLYLKALKGETLSPPSWIDKAWHLHLSFPEDYAALQSVIGREVSHREQMTREERQLAWDRGRALWSAEFDELPPVRIWPPRPARWRPYTGIAVLLSAFLIVALLITSGWGHPAIVVPIWAGGAILAAVLFAQWAPDIISRCG